MQGRVSIYSRLHASSLHFFTFSTHDSSFHESLGHSSQMEVRMVDRVEQQLGNYRLIHLLGRGGFAEVYLGEHVYLKTPAAIKLLQGKLANEQDLQGFLKEAQTIAQLVHPHIVRVLDFGVDGETPFLVMDYALGGTLRQRHPRGTLLPLTTIVPYITQVAEALQYAHEEKFIHRDVKPENILVGRRDAVLLSDFGIALIAQSSRYQSTQDIIGTIAYMSPEQIQGKPRPASDQYSLGIVVYEWLCGERPFHGSFSELCAQHTFATPTPLREKVPTLLPEVEQVVLTALAKDPRQRFASVQAFATALEQASQAEQGQIAALLHPPSQPLPPSPRVLPQQHLQPPVGEPVVVSLAPTLPVSQDLPTAQSSGSERAQSGNPELQAPSLGLDRVPPPMFSAQQAATSFPSERLLLRKGFSWYKTALLVALALLIIGSGSFLYYAVTISNVHVQATATALAAAQAYDAFVAANGTMFGFDAAHTRFNPYERVLAPANVSELTLAWTYPRVGTINTSPVVANGIVYFGADISLYALDSGSHAIRWNFQTRGEVSSTPTVVNGVVYVGSDDHSLYALDARTGSKLWSFATGGVISSSVAVVDGVVYVGSGDKSLYALDARSGSELWSFATGAFIYSSPAVANGVVFFDSSDSTLYALDARTGHKLWNSTTGYGDSSPAVANGVIYVGAEALDALTGEKLWSFAAVDIISSSPMVVNGMVYVGSENGKLYAFQLR